MIELPQLSSVPLPMQSLIHAADAHAKAYALAAMQHMREECAKVCETQDAYGDYGVPQWFAVLAAKIRALKIAGETP